MSLDAPSTQTVHAGQLIARRLRASGIDTVFTLSGGHLFSIYDGCRSEGIRLIDTRHEQTATFAAEGWSKVTRVPGVAALTAGPGVTNGMSAMAAAQQNSSPLLVLGGRAPALRWGMGSLQEIDHVPFVAPLARFAATAQSAEAAGRLVDEALRATVGAPSGVGFVDFPMDHVFSHSLCRTMTADPALWTTCRPRRAPTPTPLDRACELLSAAQRPVIMAGTNVWWGRGEAALLRLAEQRQIPVLMNGMARGAVPADHPLAFSRARSKALGEADVAVVIGVPMDFRLGFGKVFGSQTQLIVADRVIPDREHPRPVAAGLYGDLTATLSALAGTGGTEHQDWIEELRTAETAARDLEKAELADDRTPLHPMRVYAELAPMLDRDAIVVIDGGDFGSYAGRVIDSYLPGCWLDSGPFGCLGFGARLRAGRQTRPARPSGRPAARRRCIRVQRHGVGHLGPAQRAGRLGDRQQRNLGSGKAPHGGVVRLFGGRRAAPGHPLRRGGARPGGPWRAGLHPGRAAARSRACLRQWATQPSSTCSPTRASSTHAARTWPDEPRTCAFARPRPACHAQTRTLAPGGRSRTVDLCQRPPAPSPAV